MTGTLPLPKYHTIYLVLKERLRDGLYDQRVPGEIELMDEFAVSRVTIRKALEMLAQEGMIERTAGRGTRRIGASPGAAVPAPPRLTGLLDNLIAATRDTTVKVVEYDAVPAPESVARQLQLPNQATVLRTVRVRSLKSGPVSYITTWVPARLAKALGRRQLGRKPMLVLLEEAGIEIGRARQTLSARQADATVARWLQVPLGAALLSVKRLVYDRHDQPVLWLEGLYSPEHYEYEMELSRVGAIDAKVWVSRDMASRLP